MGKKAKEVPCPRFKSWWQEHSVAHNNLLFTRGPQPLGSSVQTICESPGGSDVVDLLCCYYGDE